MLVRDIVKATAHAGGVSVENLLDGRSYDLARQRHLGLLISSRLTEASWAVITRVWERVERGGTQAAALKAETLIAHRDPETLARLGSILALLQVESLPERPPTAAVYRLRPKTIRARIAQTETRLNTLRAQLRAIEGNAR